MGFVIRYSKLCLMVLFILGFHFFGISQIYNQKVANKISLVENPLEFLQKYEQLGIKDIYHSGLDSTFHWLNGLAKNLGYSTKEHNYSYNDGTKVYNLKNLEFNKKGENDSCIIICGHYDTKNGPGVNDNGTGIYAIYQIAKLTKDIDSKYSLKFLVFSGEEIDYLGSKDFVKRLNKDSVKIKFVFNLDQLGGNIGLNNSGIKCERDETSDNKDRSNDLANYMVNIYKAYTPLKAVISPAYQSDYISFRDAGYLISGIYQYSESPFTHTSNDLLKYVELNSLQDITKGALAFIIHKSEAKISIGIYKQQYLNLHLTVYYSDNILLTKNNKAYDLQVYDYLGRLVFEKRSLQSENRENLSHLPSGLYFAYVRSEKQILFHKFYIEP
jgi:aminopeptidase YwaD